MQKSFISALYQRPQLRTVCCLNPVINYNTVRQNCHESANACWNCNKSAERRNHMICEECGHLQDVDRQLNYFELLNFPVNYTLPATELTRRFRQLQTLVHPDKFSNKSEREQTNSADWSSLINKAYKTLLAPIERGRYVLKMHGHILPEDNTAVDKEFLLEMMERNEEVESANEVTELTALQTDIVKILNDLTAQLSTKLDAQAFEEATAILIKMKYMQSLQNSLKQKLETLTIGG